MRPAPFTPSDDAQVLERVPQRANSPRARELQALRAKERLGSSANPEVAKGAAELYDSARQRLLLWDIRPADIERLEKTGEPRKALTLYSPVDGFVMAKNAVRGGRVMPSDMLFDTW